MNKENKIAKQVGIIHNNKSNKILESIEFVS